MRAPRAREGTRDLEPEEIVILCRSTAPKDAQRSAAAAQHSSSEQEVDHRPQISSASRFTAGAFQYNLVITANGDLAPSDADPYRIEGEQPPITVGALIISLVRTTI